MHRRQKQPNENGNNAIAIGHLAPTGLRGRHDDNDVDPAAIGDLNLLEVRTPAKLVGAAWLLLGAASYFWLTGGLKKSVAFAEVEP